MDLSELEHALTIRKRGRRRERTVLALLLVLALVLAAVVALWLVGGDAGQ